MYNRKKYSAMGKILIHGLGQTPESWNKVLSSMDDTGKCVCPNLIEGVKNQNVDYENLYKAFSELCDKFKEPIDLCGLSLGGVLALNYAIERPEKVNSLVLIATPYKMPQMLLRLQNMCFRFMPKTMFQQMGFKKKDYIGLCNSMIELDFTDRLDNISCSVMIVCGEKDNANKKASKELARLLKNARLEIVSGAGHEVNVEDPDKLGSLLLEFYDSVEI